MPIPAGVEKVTVSSGEPLILPDGTPIQGRLLFTGPDMVTIAEDDTIACGTTEAVLVDGEFSIQLIATDATGMNPTGWTYKVTGQFTNAPNWVRYISLPKATSSVNLSDVVVANPVDPTSWMIDQAAADARYVNVTGDTMTGDLTLSGSTSDLAVGGNATVTGNETVGGTLGVTGNTTLSGTLGVTGATTLTGGISGNTTLTGDFTSTGLVTSGAFRTDIIPPTNRRPMWVNGTVVTNFQTGHGWTVGSGSGAASGNANDTSDFIKGTQAASVVTAGNGLQSQVRRTGMTAMDLTDKAIRITLKVTDVTKLNRLVFYAGTGSFTNFFQWDFHTHSTTTSQNWVSSGEWVTFTFGWSSVTSASGSYTLSSTKVPSTTTGFTDMQVAGYDDGTGAVTYRIQSIEIIDATSATFPTGVVSLTFDDSYASVYTLGRPLFDAKGWRGTCYHIAQAVGSSADYMTLAQIRNLQDYNGWEQSGHSYLTASHTNRMTSLTAAQADTDLARMRNWLVSNGLTGDTYAWPGGEYQSTTDGVSLEAIASRYFSASRSIIQAPEHASPPMPQRLRTQTGVNDGSGLGGITVSALTAAGGLLDRCQLSGSWLILCLHRVVSGVPTDSGQISVTGLQTLLDAIESRGIQVLPVGDVLRYYS